MTDQERELKIKKIKQKIKRENNKFKKFIEAHESAKFDPITDSILTAIECVKSVIIIKKLIEEIHQLKKGVKQ